MPSAAGTSTFALEPGRRALERERGLRGHVAGDPVGAHRLHHHRLAVGPRLQLDLGGVDEDRGGRRSARAAGVEAGAGAGAGAAALPGPEPPPAPPSSGHGASPAGSIAAQRHALGPRADRAGARAPRERLPVRWRISFFASFSVPPGFPASLLRPRGGASPGGSAASAAAPGRLRLLLLRPRGRRRGVLLRRERRLDLELALPGPWTIGSPFSVSTTWQKCSCGCRPARALAVHLHLEDELLRVLRHLPLGGGHLGEGVPRASAGRSPSKSRPRPPRPCRISASLPCSAAAGPASGRGRDGDPRRCGEAGGDAHRPGPGGARCPPPRSSTSARAAPPLAFRGMDASSFPSGMETPPPEPTPGGFHTT